MKILSFPPLNIHIKVRWIQIQIWLLKFTIFSYKKNLQNKLEPELASVFTKHKTNDSIEMSLAFFFFLNQENLFTDLPVLQRGKAGAPLVFFPGRKMLAF